MGSETQTAVDPDLLLSTVLRKQLATMVESLGQTNNFAETIRAIEW